MSNWIEAEYRRENDRSHLIVFEFDNETEAKEFMKMAQICKDVSDELLFYGDGVLRTIEKKGKRSARKTKTPKKVL